MNILPCCPHFPWRVPEESPFLLHMFTFPILGFVISGKYANLFLSGQFLFSNSRMLPLQPLHPLPFGYLISINVSPSIKQRSFLTNNLSLSLLYSPSIGIPPDSPLKLDMIRHSSTILHV